MRLTFVGVISVADDAGELAATATAELAPEPASGTTTPAAAADFTPKLAFSHLSPLHF